MAQTQYDAAWREEAPIGGPEDSLDAEIEAGTKGVWPRLIKLDFEVEENLRLWLDDEINNFYIERQPMLEDWKRWQTLYWAEPENKEKNFPFRRAANIVIPLAAIAVEAIHARFMNTLFSVEPFWSIRPRSEEWITAAKPFEQFLQAEVESAEALKVYEFCNSTIMELVKLGTCVGKSTYERLTKKSLRKVGNTEQELFVDVKNGASIHRVPLANYLMRLSELDPQVSPWCGEFHKFTWAQLKRMAQSGRMNGKAVKEIRNHWQDINFTSQVGAGELEKVVQKNANAEPKYTDVFEVYEIWASFDIDNDGWDEEVVIDYHKDSGTFLSIRYNWYDDLHRPYRICNLVVVEGIWTGIGVCKQSEQSQNEVTTIRRQRLDNATLANMSQLILRSGMGYGPGEPIFPGKMWFVDDPYKDIREFKLSEVYPSSFENEQSSIRDYEKRTSVNDVVVGIPQTGTPGTATGDLTRLAEGNKRFDLMLKNIKRWGSLLGVDVITNYQLFGDQDVHWMIQGEDGIYTEQVLNMPSMLIRRGAIVDLTVTDTITNREVEKQQWLQLFQVITGYYDKVINIANLIAQVSGDPTPIIMMSQRALQASDEAVKRLLDTYNVPGTDKFSLVGDKPYAPAGNGGPPPEDGTLGTGGASVLSFPDRLAIAPQSIGGSPG